MNESISLEELEKQLENRVVFDVLNDISRTAKRWNKGRALIHRVRGAGFMAETGAKNIKAGTTSIRAESTFQDMQAIDKKMYDETMGFLYKIVNSGIYSP